MYAYNDNGTFSLMETLSSRLRLPDGSTRTSLDELDEKQLATLGIYPAVVDQPMITSTQAYGEPKFAFDGSTVTAVYPVQDKSAEQVALELSQAKDAKLAELAEARWETETGGLTLPDGTVIKTDRESQGLLTGASLYVLQNASATVEWKGANDWVTLTASDLQGIAMLVRNHVQGCFSKERELGAKVEACKSLEEIEAISWA